ncbi:MAG: 5'/3'-nucleotidase SurE [Actinomycetia bacterium]|nr:5'/3'-nucleotidase SurE [Actinomycetes bacterium]
MKINKKTILLTNDDGIDAEGIYSLYRALKEDGRFDIKVIAPDKENSAVGHAITVFRPISVREDYQEGEYFGCAVDGTPADCVKLAIGAILEDLPDLLISGINRGGNLGEGIIYSGTVSAATEGTVCGVSSIAVSVDDWINPDYEYASEFAVKIAARILKNGGLPKGTLLNINVPNIDKERIKGTRITVQGETGFRDNFVKRQDPRGRDYYWMDGESIEKNVSKDSDYMAVKSGYVSITPIHYDMTDYKSLDYFKAWDIEKLK